MQLLHTVSLSCYPRHKILNPFTLIAVAGVTTYDPTLHPAFRFADFEFPEDMVSKQLDIRDVDGGLVRP